ncbi:DUF2806 domain-containing protein [Klebsiella pneumoniae]|uniref:DUF2806 domain-containing protein n=1 Tax=Klebsiella pneumoniae TaxID=573 RepID=UPI0035A6A4BD
MPDEHKNLELLGMVTKYSKPLVGIVKAVGPFILSQSKLASENYSNFKLDKERLEALSVFLKEEARLLAEERSKWRVIMCEKSGLDRVHAENNFNMLTRELNKLSTIDKVKNFVGEDEEIKSTVEISDAWIEQFNKLASSLNEEWRKELLAKAFAKELKNPGTMSLVLLNCIGSFDEKTFRYFGALVNSAIRFKELYLLPIEQTSTSMVYNIDGQRVSRGTIEYSLSHLNLIDSANRTLKGEKDIPIYITYGKRILELVNPHGDIPVANLNIRLFTGLGNNIATLYDGSSSAEGNSNFDIFRDALTKSIYIVREIK